MPQNCWLPLLAGNIGVLDGSIHMGTYNFRCLSNGRLMHSGFLTFGRREHVQS